MLTRLAAAIAIGVALLGCSAEVVPASGRLFVYARAAAPDALVFGRVYESVRFSVDGLEASTIELGEDLASLEWSVEGGRPGNTKEYVATIALIANGKVVTGKKVRFVVPWTGAKRLEVVVPTACDALVPGTKECDLDKVEDEWVDATKLADYEGAR